MAGLYVHIPFCKKKCEYCSFNSYAQMEEQFYSYTQRLIKEIRTYEKQTVETVYFGGGTPSVFPKEYLIQILEEIKSRFNLLENAEITIEINPKTVTSEGLKSLRQGGFNRVSIGIQSFNDGELLQLGRIHTASDAEEVFMWCRDAHFDNISIDLMSAIPSQTLTSLEKNLDRAIELAPEHISAYSLSIEENTPFFDKRDSLDLADEDTEREMYYLVCDKLTGAGYEHYEISNFAVSGYRARHNTGYWTGAEYIGIGAGAHSYYKGCRYSNIGQVSAYIKNEDIVTHGQVIDEKEAVNEHYILGLRLLEGIEDDGNPKLTELAEKGLLEKVDGRVRLTRRGIDLSNYVFSDLI